MSVVWFSAAAVKLTTLREGVPEPYEALNGGSFRGGPHPLSPDPLAGYVWDEPLPTEMQLYALAPVAVLRETTAVRLDFGVESAAWFEFDAMTTSDDDAALPNVTCSLSENTRREPNKTATALPVYHKDNITTYRLRTSPEWYEGIRYVWIEDSHNEGGNSIKRQPDDWLAARLVCQVRPTNYRGSFEASDAELTRLWLTGAYTVKVALLRDGIASELMDRGDRQACNFGGYGQPILRTLYAAFGEYALADTFNNATTTWKHDDDIQSYWMYWIEAIFDWYDRTGYVDTLRGYIPPMVQRLDSALALYALATTNDAPLRMFGDDERLGFEFEWPNSLPEPQLAYRMVVLRTLRRFAAGMAAINETALGERYRAQASRLVDELRDDDSSWTSRLGVHSGADAATGGFMTPEELRHLVDRGVYEDPRTLPSWSAFNSWYTLLGLDALNLTDAALELTRRTWGWNVKVGATCFWERFDPLWLPWMAPGDPPMGGINDIRTSECHPWSAGITAWLTESVLGITPTSPRFRTWDAVPRHFVGSREENNNNALSWVNGSVPTPLGDAAGAWFDVTAGRHGVDVPAGTVARVGVPKMDSGLQSVAVDGEVVWTNGSSSTGACAEEDPRFLFCRIDAPGRHAIHAVSSSPAALLVRHEEEEEEVFGGELPSIVSARRRGRRRDRATTTFVGLDTVTSGNWVGRYGSLGYVLFGYENKTNLTKLPAFVAGVVPLAWAATPARVVLWDAATHDDRALAPPTGGARVAARITSAKQASFTVDVLANASSSFRVSLYCVDFGRAGVAQNIRVAQLTTGGDNLEVVADIVPLRARSFDAGVYLTYHVACGDAHGAARGGCGSLRFRFFEMYDPAVPGGYPPKPVLSGLFFDS
eukprot:CAMPEP_0118891024 /NCGR_PEP_ID=MMETSP1166-20130328/1214_1 /TAXON_ID=1104430 /ORGANISM="Chrysoreinhardia sp, Strain CCMP3193" /LENGTH=878 /DNA_ID=CAMNT_0006829659 /DNA_START=84 /DNA_END=2720 /DNA_ORIENTATION=+